MNNDKVNANFITVEQAAERMSPFISSEYQWPVLPKNGNWQLKFIVYQDGGVVMDFLDTDTGEWWSESNHTLEVPYNEEGAEITYKILIEAGIPFLS